MPPSRELSQLGVLPGQVVADVGAGVGYFDEELLVRIGPRGHAYVIDPDGSNLAIARQRLGSDARVEFLATSAAQLGSIADASVDRVLMSLVICCLGDKEGAMDEAWRILRPGGRLLVTYPRRGRPVARRRSTLRVVPARWESIRKRRPWREIPIRSGWLVARHLLERPASSAPAD